MNTVERRKDSRLQSKKVFSHYKVEIKYYTTDEIADLVNISEKGIGLFLVRDIPIHIDQIVSLKIVNLSTHTTLTSKARIAWKKAIRENKEKGVMIGCEFENIIDLPDDIIAINYSLEDMD